MAQEYIYNGITKPKCTMPTCGVVLKKNQWSIRIRIVKPRGRVHTMCYTCYQLYKKTK